MDNSLNEWCVAFLFLSIILNLFLFTRLLIAKQVAVDSLVRKADFDKLRTICLRFEHEALLYKGYNEDLKKQLHARTFSKDEINTLIRLCHPDKHNGNEKANNVTVRLLEIRRAINGS